MGNKKIYERLASYILLKLYLVVVLALCKKVNFVFTCSVLQAVGEILNPLFSYINYNAVILY